MARDGIAVSALAQPVVPKKAPYETFTYDVSENAKLPTPVAAVANVSAAQTGILDMRGASILAFQVDASAWTATEVEAYGSFTPGAALSTFKPIFKADGTVAAVTTDTGAGDIYGFTGEDLQAILAVPFITLRSATDQGADRTIKVVKSS